MLYKTIVLKNLQEICKCVSQILRICHNKGKKVPQQSGVVGIPVYLEIKLIINICTMHHSLQSAFSNLSSSRDKWTVLEKIK